MSECLVAVETTEEKKEVRQNTLMKHKYMTQDTCLIVFNVWLAASVILAWDEHWIGVCFCVVIKIMTFCQLIRAQKGAVALWILTVLFPI